MIARTWQRQITNKVNKTQGTTEVMTTSYFAPIIEATGKIATGATTPMLQKQNKIHHNKRPLEQPAASQWQRHTETH